LLETIGAGAHSTVSKCYNKKEGKYYAVKIIDQKKVTEVELELIRLEVNILLNLPHPNIAKLKETFLTRNEHYIVSELFEDKDLFEYLNEKDHCTED
jgi:serine/threonine protein kinase